MSEAKFDSHRRLCPDGGCIGVIGDDGKCRVCGRVASGGGGAKSAAPGAAIVDDEDGYEDEDEDEDEDGATEEKAAAGGFDPGRKLCPDDSCIGVIGPEGVCTVCGKKAD